MSDGEIINHEEAYMLAMMKRSESNLARAYLELRATSLRLCEAMAETGINPSQRTAAYIEWAKVLAQTEGEK